MTTSVSTNEKKKKKKKKKKLPQILLRVLLVLLLTLERRSRWGANGDDAREEDTISSTFHHLSGKGQHVRHFSLKHRKIDLEFRKEKEEGGDGDYDDEGYDEEYFGDVAVSQKRRQRRRALKQSSSAGLELNGKARDTGYFYATLLIGTPGHQFEVIVDTGSTYTFVTCYPCASCGQHGSNAPYDAAKSSSYERVPCGSGCIFGNCRASGLCEYDEKFSEDSQVGGHVVSDVIDVGGSLGTPRIHFGCNLLETNMLKTQKANGMIALGRAEAGLHRQLKECVSAGFLRWNVRFVFRIVRRRRRFEFR